MPRRAGTLNPVSAPASARAGSRRAATAPGRDGVGSASDGARRGRPRLTPDQLNERLAEYCTRYGVALNDEGLPPFPAGQRETAQHREWMSLYKAHRRLSARGPGTADLERHQDLLTAQHARCVVCRKPLDLEEARLDAHATDPAVLHARCLDFVAAARALGPDALDRAKGRL